MDPASECGMTWVITWQNTRVPAFHASASEYGISKEAKSLNNIPTKTSPNPPTQTATRHSAFNAESRKKPIARPNKDALWIPHPSAG